MIGTTLNDKYEIIQALGSGGMANVFLANRLVDGASVAIKILKPEYAQDEEFLEQFRREERAARQLNHPNIVATLDMGEQDDMHYIVLEYIKGKTLKQLIQEQGPLPIKAAVSIGIQLCGAVAHAHENHIIHRDIKPQNVLVDMEGRVKLSDFGIAKAVSSATATLNNSSLLGSVQYASPEQARGGFVDEKSDIYSLGIVLYEMAVGTLPFKGESAVTIAIKHIQETVIPPRAVCKTIPRSLECIILKAIEKSKSRRYTSAEDMGKDLMMVLEDPDGDWITRREEAMERTNSLPDLSELMNPPPQVLSELADKPRKNSGEVFWTVLKILVGVIVLGGLGFTMALISNSIHSGQEIPLTTTIPAVAGLPEEDARLALADNGFSVDPYYESSNDVEEGYVIRSEPGEGGQAATGSMVNIIISQGPEEILMPDLTTMTLEQAQSELLSLKLILDKVEYELVEGQPGGYVIFQDPVQDTPLLAGDEINLIVSADEADMARDIPDVVGMKIEEARGVLSDKGFKPMLVITAPGNQPVGYVYQQEPVSAPNGVIGSTITLWKSADSDEANSRKLWLDFETNRANTDVRVTWTDEGGVERVVYEMKLGAGAHAIKLDVTQDAPGMYILTYYYDNRQMETQEVQLLE